MTDTERVVRAWVISLSLLALMTLWYAIGTNPFPSGTSASSNSSGGVAVAGAAPPDPGARVAARERALAARARRVNAALAARQRRYGAQLARRRAAIRDIEAANAATRATAAATASVSSASSGYIGSGGGSSYTPVYVAAPQAAPTQAAPAATTSSS